MILAAHIIIAIGSVLQATMASLRPSIQKVEAAYGLVALTLISGTYLTLTHPDHMAASCVTGVLYISIVFAALLGAHRKLANATIRVRNRRR